MLEVKHYPTQQVFTAHQGIYEARLQYQFLPQANEHGARIIDFNSTYVSPELRGKGVAEKLVRHGIKWAKEQGYELQASCWYAAKFLR
jgi:uncharacterized protein